MVSKGRFAYLPDLSFALIWMFWVGTLRGRNLDGGTLKRTKKIRIKTGGRKVKKKKGGGETHKTKESREATPFPRAGGTCLLACWSSPPQQVERARERERDGEREETRRGSSTRRSEGHPRTARFTRERTGPGSPSTAMHGRGGCFTCRTQLVVT